VVLITELTNGNGRTLLIVHLSDGVNLDTIKIIPWKKWVLK